MQNFKSSDFFYHLNLPDVWNELGEDTIANVTQLQGLHPFFNATNFKIPTTVEKIVESVGLKLYIEGCFLFHFKPMNDGPIHIDGGLSNYQRLVGLNWTWFGENTSMHWYKQIGDPKILPYRNINVPVFDYSNTEEIFSTEILGCNLVNIKLPHQVKSKSNHIRYTLSVSFEGNPSWEEVVDRFKDYIEDRSDGH